MAAPHQILLYGRERREGFLARARAHALEHYAGMQIVERNPVYFGRDGCEATAAAVCVESCFAEIVTGYRERGVPVVTERELGARHEDIQDQGHQVARPENGDGQQDGQHAEGEGALGQVTPITTARRRGRPRKVA